MDWIKNVHPVCQDVGAWVSGGLGQEAMSMGGLGGESGVCKQGSSTSKHQLNQHQEQLVECGVLVGSRGRGTGWATGGLSIWGGGAKGQGG